MNTEDDVKLRMAKSKPAGSRVHVSTEGSAICEVVDGMRRDLHQLQRQMESLTQFRRDHAGDAA